jgi:hypothetical protein
VVGAGTTINDATIYGNEIQFPGGGEQVQIGGGYCC